MLVEGFALEYRRGREAKLARLRIWCGRDAQLKDSFAGVALPKARPE